MEGSCACLWYVLVNIVTPMLMFLLMLIVYVRETNSCRVDLISKFPRRKIFQNEKKIFKGQLRHQMTFQVLKFETKRNRLRSEFCFVVKQG